MKKYPTIGCCGIDCGLCPRYYTKGSSRCPGCDGPDFSQKHPTCPFVTCCMKRDFEVCAYCEDFICSKFKDFDVADSFVTHKKSMDNLEYIKSHGIDEFVRLQNKRIRALDEMLGEFDDGRSKSYYCISCALISISELEKILASVREETRSLDNKEKANMLRSLLGEAAIKEDIKISLDNKGKY